MVGKHAGPGITHIRTGQQLGEIVTLINVVAQHQCAGVLFHEILADDEGLGQAIRAGLNGILNVHAQLAAVTQQLRKRGVSCRVLINSTSRMPARISSVGG